MDYEGHSFYFKGEHNGSRYYSCAQARTTRCRARLIVREGVVRLRGIHDCTQVSVQARVIDVREEMKAIVETLCTERMRLLPSSIWELAKTEIRERYGDVPGLVFFPKSAAAAYVHKVRRAATGGDAFRAVEMEPDRWVSEADQRNFLQFNVGYTLNGEYRRFIGFGHPDLIIQLKQPGVTLFIDATFKVTPAPFNQTVIIMMYDRPHDMYVPCFYVLMDAKDHWAYWHAFNFIKVQCDLKCTPQVVVCDFERALHLAIEDHFAGAYILGCLFHWKQALRRKMIELCIPVDDISVAMRPGFMDVLTVLPEHKIRGKGIQWVQKKLKRHVLATPAARNEHGDKWNAFWRYFTCTWLVMYAPACWNISAMLKDKVEVVNRTNNPLEAYNRRLADAFDSTQPPLLTFVATIKDQANKVLEDLADIRSQRRASPVHAPPIVYPDVPYLR